MQTRKRGKTVFKLKRGNSAASAEQATPTTARPSTPANMSNDASLMTASAGPPAHGVAQQALLALPETTVRAAACASLGLQRSVQHLAQQHASAGDALPATPGSAQQLQYAESEQALDSAQPTESQEEYGDWRFVNIGGSVLNAVAPSARARQPSRDEQDAAAATRAEGCALVVDRLANLHLQALGVPYEAAVAGLQDAAALDEDTCGLDSARWTALPADKRATFIRLPACSRVCLCMLTSCPVPLVLAPPFVRKKRSAACALRKGVY